MKYRRMLGAGAMVSLGLGLGPGCNLILGLQDFKDGPPAGSMGGGGGGGGTGEGGGVEHGACKVGDTQPCYGGPMATKNVGACKGGTQTCDAQTLTFGACVGQALPAAEECSKAGDEDCDGSGCSDVLWTKVFPYSGLEQDERFLMATDAQGNVYLSGRFSASVDFGGAPLVPVGKDVFVAKLDKDGNHLWSKRFGDAGPQGADAIAVDAKGNVTLAGLFAGTIDFGLGPLVNSGQPGIFVATLDGDGKPLASNAFSGGNLSSYTHVFDVAVDSGGNVILSGACIGTLNFGGGVSVTSAGGIDVYVWDSFVVKLSPSLTGLWGTLYGDPNNEWASIFLRVDSSDSILMGGDFQGDMKIGFKTMSSVRREPFLAKLAASGTAQWVLPFGTPRGPNSNLSGLAVDKQGGTFISGFFDGTASFDGESSVVGPGGYLAKFDAGGANRYGKINADAREAEIAIDGAGNVITTGGLLGPVDFGGGPIGGPSSFYLVKRKPDSSYVWGKAFGTENGFGGSLKLSTEPLGNTITLAGRLFQGTVDFGKGPVGPGLYVARFNP